MRLDRTNKQTIVVGGKQNGSKDQIKKNGTKKASNV